MTQTPVSLHRRIGLVFALPLESPDIDRFDPREHENNIGILII